MGLGNRGRIDEIDHQPKRICVKGENSKEIDGSNDEEILYAVR